MKELDLIKAKAARCDREECAREIERIESAQAGPWCDERQMKRYSTRVAIFRQRLEAIEEATAAADPLPAILPCPFCGAVPKFLYVDSQAARPEIEKAYWSLGCPGRPRACTSTPMSFGDTKAEAIAQWNTRQGGDEIRRLEREIAEESAASDIECWLNGWPSADDPQWYDSTQPCEGVDRQYTDKAVRYLDLRGRLARLPNDRHLVRPIYPEREQKGGAK